MIAIYQHMLSIDHIERCMMKKISQSPTDLAFVQNPYDFYQDMLALNEPVFWQDYNMLAVFDYETVSTLFKDKRLGREIPADKATPHAPHLAPFYDIEAHSMLELEPPRHTRLRSLVLRAFTSRRIAALGPEISALCHQLIDNFPDHETDLLPAYASQIPVIIIARLLGVPESMATQLLTWSNDMVLMYQARRTRALEDRAVAASQEFADFIRHYIDEKRKKPADDLLTHLIAAEQDGDKLSTDELVTTCILLLNAGHEATVHTLGNGIKALLDHNLGQEVLTPNMIDATVEEILRYTPPVHLFTRYAYEPIEIGSTRLNRGDQIAFVYGATGRDPARWANPNTFSPNRPIQKNLAFGGGIHFCVGAPLARLELQNALPILFERCPNLRLITPPQFNNIYHFHGLNALNVSY
jgi:cytochrome P450